MTVTPKITDHAVRGLAILLSQFIDAPNLRAIAEILLDQVQELEDAIIEVRDDTTLDNSIGAQLDQWGKLLGVPRDGLTDAKYRKLVKVIIDAYRSGGNPQNITAVLSVLADDAPVEYTPLFPANFMLGIVTDTPPAADELARWLDLVLSMRPAGVGLGALAQIPTGAFRFDSGPGLDEGKLSKDLLS